MTHLSELPPAAAETLASLPYRVGMWMSGIDAEGGPQFNPAEVDVLEHIIKDEAKKTGTVTGAVAHEAMKRNAHWQAWMKTAPSVLADCAQIMGLLEKILSAGDLAALRHWLLGIGTAVAEAYGEFSTGEDHTGRRRPDDEPRHRLHHRRRADRLFLPCQPAGESGDRTASAGAGALRRLILRHCERSEAIQSPMVRPWIASLRSQ